MVFCEKAICYYWLFYLIGCIFINVSDSKINKRSWREKLGKCDFTLASLLLLNNQSSSGYERHLSLRCLPNPQDVISSVQQFTSWIVWGNTGEVSSSFTRRSTELAIVLLRHGQYDAVEVCHSFLQ